MPWYDTYGEKLLKRINEERVRKGYPCFLCGIDVQVESIEGLVKYIDNHTANCELAEEIGG